MSTRPPGAVPAAAPTPTTAPPTGPDALRVLQGQVAALARELAELRQAGADGRDRPEGDDVGGGVRALTDAKWLCRKCRALLGFYDTDTDVLRIRYKDHMTYVRVGVGGFVQVLCRGCGEVNTQAYVPPGDDPGADPADAPG